MAYANNVGVSAANTAVAKTLTAVTGRTRSIKGVYVGYDATPTGGLLTIQDGVGGDIILSLPITSPGPAPVNFAIPKESTAGNALVITLGAGGAGVIGHLNLEGRDGLA